MILLINAGMWEYVKIRMCSYFTTLLNLKKTLWKTLFCFGLLDALVALLLLHFSLQVVISNWVMKIHRILLLLSSSWIWFLMEYCFVGFFFFCIIRIMSLLFLITSVPMSWLMHRLWIWVFGILLVLYLSLSNSLWFIC